MSRAWMRPLKFLAIALAGLVALAVLALGGVLVLGQSAWGSERILSVVLPRLNSVLAGKVEVRRLRFSVNRIVVDGFVLRDPEGAMVARIGRLEVSFLPLALLSRRLNLRQVDVDGPVVLLRQEAAGESNLARAIAPRNPIPDSRSSGAEKDEGGRLTVELGSLSLRRGSVEILDERAHPALRRLRIVDLNIRGAGRFHDGQGLDVRADLQLRGRATHPLQEPVSLDVAGHLVRAAQILAGQVDVEIGFGETTVHVRGHSGSETNAMTLDLERARIAPALIALMVPDAKVKTPVLVNGRATLDGMEVAGQVEVTTAGASVTMAGSGNVERGVVRGLSVRAREVDLSRLLAEAPPSNLAIDVDAHGEGQSLSTLRGAATLHMPRGQLGGYAVGPLRLRVDAERGRYRVVDMMASVPGGRITGALEATSDTLAVRAAIEVRDLGAVVRSVTAGRSAGTPRAAGQGRIELAMGGALRAPWLHIKGQLVGLIWQGLRVPRLNVAADIADVRRPLASVVRLTVPELTLGPRSLRGLSLTLNAAGPRLAAKVSLAAPEVLRMDAGGAWNRERTGVRLDHLALVVNDGTWMLAGPAQVVFDNEGVQIAGLDLRGKGGQSIRVDFDKTARTVRGDLAIAALDLAALPTSLLPDVWRTSGRLDVNVGMRGRVGHPAIALHVALTDGQVAGMRGIALSADLNVDAARASGDVDLRALGVKLAGHFDLPSTWPPPAAAPLRVDLRATGIDLQRVASQVRAAYKKVPAVVGDLPQELGTELGADLRGTGAFDIKVDGTGSAPQLRVNAEVKQLVLGQVTLGEVAVRVNAAGTRPTGIRIELRQEPEVSQDAGAGFVRIQSDFSLADLIRQPTLSVAMERLAFASSEIEANLDRIALAPLLGSREGQGTLALDLRLKGSAKVVRGKANLTVAGFRTKRLPPTDGTMQVELGEHDIQIAADVHRRGVALLALKARLDAPQHSSSTV